MNERLMNIERYKGSDAFFLDEFEKYLYNNKLENNNMNKVLGRFEKFVFKNNIDILDEYGFKRITRKKLEKMYLKLKVLPRLGHEIKKQRELKNLSLMELARLSDMSPTFVSQLENGKSSFPKTEGLIKIASALKINSQDLLNIAGYAQENLGKKRTWKEVISSTMYELGIKNRDLEDVVDYIEYKLWSINKQGIENKN